MDNLAYLDASISGRLSKADFDTKLPDARAALIDEITAARMGELDPANLPADVAARLSKADFDTKGSSARRGCEGYSGRSVLL